MRKNKHFKKYFKKYNLEKLSYCNTEIKAIDTLKAQIAQMMMGQSSTRQAQIEELRKKLIEAAKEANDLK